MKISRLQVQVHGAVQGVGFRPFVFRLANALSLAGWIKNSPQGVLLEIEGEEAQFETFLTRLPAEKPAAAIIQKITTHFLEPAGFRDFNIHESEEAGVKTALILPDIATCADCVREIFDQANRRFRYPFTNCTNCGPRFSIIKALPYDRASTSMNRFSMCRECNDEYHDPQNRRFHAQPNACPRCGPELQLWNSGGKTYGREGDPLGAAVEEICDGKILALKGIGGFQFLVDARNERAVTRLRERKRREEKPFALMFPSLAHVREHCSLSELEERLLTSSAAPVVLLPRVNSPLAKSIAPDNPNLGAMLPYSPLHHLLMRNLDFPVVATSGNLSGEPICIAENEALQRLGGIADFFLVHDRPIVRHVDDSIVRVVAGRELILRRARGYAPLPVAIASVETPTILAVGAHLKNTVALALAQNVFVSQHVGDLETAEAHAAFRTSATDLPNLYGVKPDLVACDLHPDYLSSKFAAEAAGAPTIARVQHHWAHIAGTMAEHGVVAPALGVSWDGTGYGSDGTIWGGEFLLAEEDGNFLRVAHLRTFCLPGGNAAIKEPRRSALGLLYEIFGNEVWHHDPVTRNFSVSELSSLRTMLERKINSPVTSSAGRLFDAVASILNLRQRTNFEGQAAMLLEFAGRDEENGSYPFAIGDGEQLIIDWEPMIRALLDDSAREIPVGMIVARFHRTLTEMIVALAQRREEKKVILGGGCFQNRCLTEGTIDRLRAAGFEPFWPKSIPPNDGGIAFGQVAAVRMRKHLHG